MGPGKHNTGRDQASNQGKRDIADADADADADAGNETDEGVQPAVPTAVGVVTKSGRFKCKIRVNGVVCGGYAGNRKSNIRSHIAKKHRTGSAYKRDQDKAHRWPCAYGCKDTVFPNFHTLLSHCRKSHNFKGESHGMKLLAEDMMREEGYNSSEDEKDEDLGLDAPDMPPRGPPRGPYRDDEDQEPPAFGTGSHQASTVDVH